MKVGSLFSGIGGMDKGLTDAGMEIRWHVEIDKWGQKVLSRRFPHGQLYSDIRERRDYEWVDLISFGFPCTDLSVAGKRSGLGGDESRLFWAAMAIVRRVKPTWLLIENVPGLLSSNEGRDFGVVLGALAQCGYWWSYRVLDSQYFGVAQRRRRVFIVGHLGGPCPPEILFEPVGLGRDCEAGVAPEAVVAHALTRSVGHHGHGSPRGDRGDNLVVGTLSGGGHRGYRVGAEAAAGGQLIPNVSHPLLAKSNSSFDDSLETYVVNGRQDLISSLGTSLPLDTNGRTVTVIQDARGVRNKEQHGIGIQEGGPMFTLDGTSQHAVGIPRQPIANALRSGRRTADSHGSSGNIDVTGTLTGAEAHNGNSRPIPDNYVVGPSRGLEADVVGDHQDSLGNRFIGPEPTPFIGAETDADGVRKIAGTPRRLDLSVYCKCPDGPQYRSLGNAVTAPVAEWIGRGILRAEGV